MTKQHAPQSDPQRLLPLTDAPLIGESREQRCRRILSGMAGNRIQTAARYWNDQTYREATQLVRDTERRLREQRND